MAAKVWLKEGREKSLLRRHPWVFEGAIARLEGEPQAGETVQVCDAHGQFLAWGAYSPSSQIRVRLWSFNPQERIDALFLRRRLEAALRARQGLLADSQTNAWRLVHAESDGLPGLIVDQYADTLVAQFLSSGAERWREEIATALMDLTQARRLYERSDVEVRRLEGLPDRSGPLRGEAPPDRLEIVENGLRFYVDVYQGHKTGFYLDQRRNRRLVRDLAQGRHVLDCFCYSGGFLVNALAGGAASALGLDTSAEALALAEANIALNRLAAQRVTLEEADVFQALRALRDRGRRFDLIVLDPPKFAPTAAHIPQAARGYKDINLLAFKLLNPGGILLTFSCSGGVDAALFQKIVADAAVDAGIQAQIFAWLFQAEDHPVSLAFPEGIYLKGLAVRVS